MVSRIQELRDKLPLLVAEEKRLRAERTSVCFPERDENGEVTLKIDNEPLYAELTARMNEKAADRAKILDKVARIEHVLGEGAQNVPTGYGDEDYVARKKMELATFCIHKVIEPGNGDRYYTLPEKAIQDPRYLAEKARLMPEIERLEAKMVEERRIAELADAILAEP